MTDETRVVKKRLSEEQKKDLMEKFSFYDQNGNGEVSFDEYLAVVRDCGFDIGTSVARFSSSLSSSQLSLFHRDFGKNLRRT